MNFSKLLVVLLLFVAVQGEAQSVQGVNSLPSAARQWLVAGTAHLHFEGVENGERVVRLDHQVRPSGDTLDPQSYRFSTRRCRPFVRSVDRVAPPRVLRAGGHTVSVRTGSIRAGRRTLWSIADGLCGGAPNIWVSESARVESFVGPILSVRVDTETREYLPEHTSSVRVWDVRSGRSMSILDVVADSALVQAVFNDPDILSRFEPTEWPERSIETALVSPEMAAAQTWQDVKAVLTGDNSDFSGFDGFAFDGYDLRTHRATLKLAFRSTGPGTRYLTLDVPVRARWRRTLERASAGDGRFVSSIPEVSVN